MKVLAKKKKNSRSLGHSGVIGGTSIITIFKSVNQTKKLIRYVNKVSSGEHSRTLLYIYFFTQCSFAQNSSIYIGFFVVLAAFFFYFFAKSSFLNVVDISRYFVSNYCL
jgi:hypothetical protein